ncbi:uncharacterized protein LOC133353395 [Lethenteron reissneri]|uniref:uncharacterized protein LOC133353395 n=1 Tax=Lethenteron reissneri TaxID=7753 RepID=UPI002AB671AF|nr:uncharacterized protein LOC133353395 [Lethenteron reissneri]
MALGWIVCVALAPIMMGRVSCTSNQTTAVVVTDTAWTTIGSSWSSVAGGTPTTTPSGLAPNTASTTAGSGGNATTTTTTAATVATVATNATTVATATNATAVAAVAAATNATTAVTAPVAPGANTASGSAGGSNGSAGFYCQKMSCAGENCYQNKTFLQHNETCMSSNPMCWFLRSTEGTAVNYTSGCVSNNINATWCTASGTASRCIVECCNTSLCLNFPAPPTTAATTTTTAVTTTSEPMSDRVCQMFTCSGADCFIKVIPAPQRCYKSQLYCELVSHMEHSQISFTAGCSSRCKGKVASCASQPECFQECCAGSTSCLKLDGKLYDVSGGPRPEALLGAPGHAATLLLVAATARALL